MGDCKNVFPEKRCSKKLDIQKEEKETLYYLKYYSEVKVIRKAKKQKRELTPEEKRRAERDSRKKESKGDGKRDGGVQERFYP